MVARDLLLAEDTGGRFTSPTSRPAARLGTGAARPKRRGLPVTCEVTPHHLLLTDEAVVRLTTRT